MVCGVILAYTILQTQGGLNLHWSPASAPYSLNQNGSDDIPPGNEVPAVVASFDQWNAAANFHYRADCITTKGFDSVNPSHQQNAEKNDPVAQALIAELFLAWPSKL